MYLAFHSSVDRQRLPAQDPNPDMRDEPKSDVREEPNPGLGIGFSEPNPDAARRPFPVREGLG